MVKKSNIIAAIEAHSPLAGAESYDNTGFMLGFRDGDVKKVMLSLDATPSAVKHASEAGCELLLVHHPLIFKETIRCIDADSYLGGIINSACKNGVSIYSAHTNLDFAEDGLCVRLAKMFGLQNVRLLDGKAGEYEHGGAFGEFEKPVSLESLTRKVGKILSDDSVRFVGKPNDQIKSAVVVSGAGGGDVKVYEEAMKVADVYITAEVRHHLAICAFETGGKVIEYSHYSSEIIALDAFSDILKPFSGKIEVIMHYGENPLKAPK